MTLSDETLVQRTREGDHNAFTTLWKRHVEAAHWAARAIPGSHDPDDVVQESFTRLLEALKSSTENPIDGPFRQYLYVMIRQVAELSDTQSSLPIPFQPALFSPEDIDVSVADHALISLAYESLSKEWKTILWYTEVEQLTATEISPYLGISPNAVSALAYRAREGLRSAWLQAHIRSTSINRQCEAVVSQLGNYVRGSLGPRKCSKIQSHVWSCTSCSALLDELNNVSRSLRANALFAVFGVLGLSTTCGKIASIAGVTSSSASLSTTGTLVSSSGSGLASAGATTQHLTGVALLPAAASVSSISTSVVGLSITGLAASVVVGATFMFGSNGLESTPSSQTLANTDPSSSTVTSPSAQHSRGFFGHSARFIANSSDKVDSNESPLHSSPAELGMLSQVPPTVDLPPVSADHQAYDSDSSPDTSQPTPSSDQSEQPKSGASKSPSQKPKPKSQSDNLQSETETAPSAGTPDKNSTETPASDSTNSPTTDTAKRFLVFQSNLESDGPPYFAGEGPPNVDIVVEDQFGTVVGTVRTGADSNWSLRVSDSFSSRGVTDMTYQFYIADSTGNRTHAAQLHVSQLVA